MDIDPNAFKAAARIAWEHSAAGWDAHTPVIHRWLAPVSARMLDRAGVRAGHRVLDVAAGAGDQTLAIAERVGPDGAVLATDLSPTLLDHALARCRQAGFHRVETLTADAESLSFGAQGPERPTGPAGPGGPSGFDAAICRLGLMLMPRPLDALRAMHDALRPGARACSLVFGRPAGNPCVVVLMKTACQHAGLPMPEPTRPGSLLSLGQPGVLEQMHRDAGFDEVEAEYVDAPFELPSARAYLDFVRDSASPIQQILDRLDPERRQAAWDDIETQLRRFEREGRWVGPNELLLIGARRGG